MCKELCCLCVILAVWPGHVQAASAAATHRGSGAAAFSNSSDDDPQQRSALVSLAEALGTYLTPFRPGQEAWGTPGSSYCTWPGVICCHGAAALLPTPCNGSHDVVGLNFTGAGVTGSLPGQLDPALTKTLQLLYLGHNPGLVGAWPATLELQQLMALDVRVSPAA